MFRKNPDTKSGLQKEINHLLEEMSSVDKDSEKYAQIADQLVKLYELKEVDSKSGISMDAIVTAVSSLIGIIWITRYERDHVVTSKALGFIRTLRP